MTAYHAKRLPTHKGPAAWSAIRRVRKRGSTTAGCACALLCPVTDRLAELHSLGRRPVDLVGLEGCLGNLNHNITFPARVLM